MRHQLKTAYRRGGVRHPAGAAIEGLTAEDLTILGGDAEPLAETAAKDPAGEDAPPDLREVLRAMAAEDPGRAHAGWWTQDGRPEVAELRRRGLAVSAADRDAAWADLGPIVDPGAK